MSAGRGEVAANRALAAVIRGDDRMASADRVAIYAGMYVARLHEVMKEDYPATAAVLGQSFAEIVREYLVAYPPKKPSVFFAGQSFPAFLRSHPICRRMPYLADLAALERAMVEVFVAPDVAPLDEAALRAISAADWPRLRMRTVSALRLFEVQWRVAALLRDVQSGRRPKKPRRGKKFLLVWRIGGRVYFRETDAAEAAALKLLGRGATFDRVCEKLAGARRDAGSVKFIMATLRRWLREGVIARLGPSPARQSVSA